ncbi:MAG: hypothetical protein E2598_07190 [Sphingobium sp.]|nr:hypothetical protein [Sphingobium sp.]
MKLILTGAACAALVAHPAWATETSAPAAASVETTVAAPAPVTPIYLTLPVNTELTITPNNELNSKKLKEGDTFLFSTVFDVMMNNQIVIPKGTRGQGWVSWRTGKGAFGKSAKMEISYQWIELGGRRIAVNGTHRQEGRGNTGATIGAVVAAGVFGAFVTGKSATIPNGMNLKAYTTEPVQFIAANNVAQPNPAPAAVTATLAPTPTAAIIP